MEETYVLDPHGSPGREYCIRMRLTDPATYPPEAGISFEQVLILHCSLLLDLACLIALIVLMA